VKVLAGQLALLQSCWAFPRATACRVDASRRDAKIAATIAYLQQWQARSSRNHLGAAQLNRSTPPSIQPANCLPA
jgi:hypothetical protein